MTPILLIKGGVSKCGERSWIFGFSTLACARFTAPLTPTASSPPPSLLLLPSLLSCAQARMPPVAVGWNGVFPIYRARAVYKHQVFSACRDICWIGQKLYWMRIANCTFNYNTLSSYNVTPPDLPLLCTIKVCILNKMCCCWHTLGFRIRLHTRQGFFWAVLLLQKHTKVLQCLTHWFTESQVDTEWRLYVLTIRACSRPIVMTVWLMVLSRDTTMSWICWNVSPWERQRQKA